MANPVSDIGDVMSVYLRTKDDSLAAQYGVKIK